MSMSLLLFPSVETGGHTASESQQCTSSRQPRHMEVVKTRGSPVSVHRMFDEVEHWNVAAQQSRFQA